MTYSEDILENHSILTLNEAVSIYIAHGFEEDELFTDLGRHATYASAAIMTALGY